MFKSYKYINLFLIALALSIIIIPDLCFAVKLEVDLPGVTGTTNLLPSYVKAVILTFMGVAGGLAILFFVIGAVKYMASLGTEGMKDAKDRMIKAILGLILLLSSYIVLSAINPQLTTLKNPTDLSKLCQFSYIYGGEWECLPSTVIDDTSNLAYDATTAHFLEFRINYPPKLLNPATGARDIPNCDPNDLPYIVYAFREKNLTGNVTRIKLACGDTKTVSGQSFQIEQQSAGVYFYVDSSCGANGYRSEAMTSSQELPFEALDKAGCVEVVNDPKNKIYYGAILHQNFDWNIDTAGRCTDPITNIDADNVANNNYTAKKENTEDIYASISIFQINKTPRSSGDGLYFYSEPFGRAGGGGEAFVPDNDTNRPVLADTLDFDYTWADATANPMGAPTFYQKSGSIVSTGHYFVVLYARGGSVPTKPIPDFCRPIVDDSDADNLKPVWLGGEYGKKVYSVYIARTP